MQRSVTLWIVLLFCGIIAACAGSQGAAEPVSPAKILADLKQLTIPDLQRAQEINKAAGDLEGLQCSTGLLAILQDPHVSALQQPIGVASTVADIRAARLGVAGQGDILRRINLACSAAFTEAAYTYSKLLLSLGVKVTVPGAQVLPVAP